MLKLTDIRLLHRDDVSSHQHGSYQDFYVQGIKRYTTVPTLHTCTYVMRIFVCSVFSKCESNVCRLKRAHR